MDIRLEEVTDERIPDNASPAVIEEYRVREGMRLLGRNPKDADLVVLDQRGTLWSSEDLADYLQGCSLSGTHRVSFLIGGVYGHSVMVTQRAKRLVSVSRMTFNHQIIRLMLLEQIYRASKINRNEPYHR